MNKKLLLALLAIPLLLFLCYLCKVGGQYLVVVYYQNQAVLPLATFIHNDFEYIESMNDCEERSSYLSNSINQQNWDTFITCDSARGGFAVAGYSTEAKPDALLYIPQISCENTPQSVSLENVASEVVGYPTLLLDYKITAGYENDTYPGGIMYATEYGSKVLNTSLDVTCTEEGYYLLTIQSTENRARHFEVEEKDLAERIIQNAVEVY